MRPLFILALVAFAAGCASPDPRYASPEATLETLFSAYGVADLPEREVQRRLFARERFELLSRESMLGAFADYKLEEQEGLTGFVFGRLVARKSSLNTECEARRCLIRPEGEEETPPVVMVEQSGEWKILLAESVPREVQAQLFALHRRAGELTRRGR